MDKKNQENPKITNNNRQKWSTRKKLLYIGLPILILLLLVPTAYAIHLYTKAEDTVEDSFEDIERDHNKDNDTSGLRAEAVDPIEDNVSLLIIGVDDSEKRELEENSRSDALLLATFNKEHKNVKLLSIPRDSYTYVPEVGYYDKITHAHFHGGPSATVETVEHMLNVPVDYYVRLDFEAFIEVVDTLGGITYDVPFEMHEMDSKDKKNAIHLLPGEQRVDGEEALALARTRKYDSDIERGKRQQELIKQIVKQSVSLSSVLKLDDLIEAVGRNMTTNLSFNHMKDFVSYGLKKNVDISTLNIDGSGGYMDDGLWYFQTERESVITVSNALREHLDLSPADPEEFELQEQQVMPYSQYKRQQQEMNEPYKEPENEQVEQEPEVEEEESTTESTEEGNASDDAESKVDDEDPDDSGDDEDNSQDDEDKHEKNDEDDNDDNNDENDPSEDE